jgi:hypothetical protein
MATEASGTLPWIERIASSFPRRPFERFHRETVPDLVAERGGLVETDLAGAPALAFRTTEGAAFTWHADSTGGRATVRLVEGTDGAATVVDLDEHTFSDVINELLTASGAVQTGRARVAVGALAGWQRWEPAIQSLCTGRPVYSPAVWATLVDRDGAPLDLHQVFAPDDDPAVMAHFFATAGYLHVRGVFDAGEISGYAAGVEDARRGTSPGDGFSWWSVNARGEEVVTRINHLERFSPAIAELVHDPRLARLASLAYPGLRPCDDRLDGPMVFVKNSDVVKGNGDLRWHVDDGSGGHSVMCPLVQVGVQLDHANAENGQLRVLAGSHRYTKHWPLWGEEGDVPIVAIETEPGDVTVHDGDTMHTTPPPTGPHAGRRALYVKFAEQKTFDWIPAGCHYNDVQFRRDESGRMASRAATWEGQPEH